MTREEHTALIQKVIENRENQATVSELLTQLSDDYGVVLTESNSNLTSAEKLKIDNESLRDTNMRLFLKVGDMPNVNDGNKEKKLDETPTFDALFDEKGNLK